MYILKELDKELELAAKRIANALIEKDVEKTQRAYDILMCHCIKRDIFIYTSLIVDKVIDEFEVKPSPTNGCPLIWTKTHYESSEEPEKANMYAIEYSTIHSKICEEVYK